MKAHSPNRDEDEKPVVRFLKKIDFYKDLPVNVQGQTMAGSWISIICMFIILTQFWKHTSNYLNFQKSSEIMIDINSGVEKVHINLDIALYKSPCAPLSLDVLDVTGVNLVDINGNINKIRLDKEGKEIGSKEHIGENGHTEINVKT
jgi:hypothetical protein